MKIRLNIVEWMLVASQIKERMNERKKEWIRKKTKKKINWIKKKPKRWKADDSWRKNWTKHEKKKMKDNKNKVERKFIKIRKKKKTKKWERKATGKKSDV